MRPIGHNEANDLITELLRWSVTRPRIHNHATPIVTVYTLMKLIAVDDGAARCTASPTQHLIQELKKTPELWNRVKPYLRNSDARCLSCKHSKGYHHHETGVCSYSYGGKCLCKHWVQREW